MEPLNLDFFLSDWYFDQKSCDLIKLFRRLRNTGSWEMGVSFYKKVAKSEFQCLLMSEIESGTNQSRYFKSSKTYHLCASSSYKSFI